MRILAKMRAAESRSQSGFTILELMIATSVFSIILLVVAAGIISFTKQYVKGITTSNTQAVARSVMADVVQNVQFSGGSISGDTTVNPAQVCIGNTAYYYVRGQQVTGTQHGLVKDNSPCSSDGIDLSHLTPATQHELLNQHMRLAEFSFSQPDSSSTNAQITISVVSGEYDMLTDKNGNSLHSESGAPSDSFDWPSVRCKAGAGSQFCAVSRLTTFVQGRIGN